jgi:hypothetical protein
VASRRAPSRSVTAQTTVSAVALRLSLREVSCFRDSCSYTLRQPADVLRSRTCSSNELRTCYAF